MWDVITTVFRDAGFTKFEDKRQNGTGDIKLEYCVQYEETSLDFVTRLMETYGLYYFFTHSDEQAHAGDGGRSEFPHGPGEGGSVQYR